MEIFGDEKTFMSVTADDFCETGAAEESYASDEAGIEEYVNSAGEATDANAAACSGATSGVGAGENDGEPRLFGGDINSGATDYETRDLVEGVLFGDDNTFCSIVISNAEFFDGVEYVFDDYINKDNLIAGGMVGADETVVGYGAGMRGSCAGAMELQAEWGLFGSECSEIDAIFEKLNRKFAGVRAADCGRIKVGNNYGAFEIERRCGEPYARFCPCPPPKQYHADLNECSWERPFDCSGNARRNYPPKCSPNCPQNCGDSDCAANCGSFERSSKCGRRPENSPNYGCNHNFLPNWGKDGDCEVNCGRCAECAQKWGQQPACPPNHGCRPSPHCKPSCKQLSREIYFRLLRVAQMVGHLGNCAPNECAFETICSVKQNLNMLAVAMFAVTKRVCDEKPVCASEFAAPNCGFLQGVDACVCELGDILQDIALLQSLPCARGVYGALGAVAFGVSRCQAELAALLPRRCW